MINWVHSINLPGLGTFVAVLVLGLAAAAVLPTAHADTIYVDDDNVDGPWDGSEEHPYQHIQDGIDVANFGDTVLVLPGTYAETIFYQGKHITLTSTDPQDPAVVASTTIDASAAGSAVVFSGSEAP